MIFKKASFSDPRFSMCTLCIGHADRSYDRPYYIRIIQQKYDPNTKHTWWGPVDSNYISIIMQKPLIEAALMRFGTSVADGDNVVTIRQLCRYLGVPMPKKELWETRF